MKKITDEQIEQWRQYEVDLVRDQLRIKWNSLARLERAELVDIIEEMREIIEEIWEEEK